MEIHAIGIDLGKTLFHLVGVDASGRVVVRKRCSRTQLLTYTANVRVQVIGMEACSGAHFLARALQQQGHDVRLMPAQYVKPYVKTNKSDYIDAEAIAEAVQRPTMRFVPIKTEEQLDLQAVQRVRERWVAKHTILVSNWRVTMSRSGRAGFFLVANAAAFAIIGAAAHAQQTRDPKPTELPNPYRLVEGWPTLPKSMNGGLWGEVIRVHVNSDGNIWVFHRCFNTVPPGHATCIGRGDSNPPILEFDPSGKLLKSFGVGLFAYPHGFTIDGDGNLWVSDVNDEASVLGMSAKNADGVVRGQEVLKLSPVGKVLMTIGKEGVSGNGPDTFDRPTGVAVAPNGDVFVTDGHLPNKHNSARVVKFSKDGRFISTWGHKGAAPGDFVEPHDIFIGGSQGHVFVADRGNNRVQVFDQDGHFIAAWKQFGQPSSVFVGKDDTIYVGASFPDPAARKGELRGIVVGSAKDGSLKFFIPDPADHDKLDVGTSASGIAADDAGTIYAADVAAHNLRKYVKVK